MKHIQQMTYIISIDFFGRNYQADFNIIMEMQWTQIGKNHFEKQNKVGGLNAPDFMSL